jgi:hypothetical protein
VKAAAKDAVASKQLPAAVKRKPPAAGMGRKPGSVNKTTKALREAILEAAERSGRDQQGKGGLVGYLKRVADEDLKAFAGLLGKVLPLQVTGEGGGPIPLAAISMTTADYQQIAAEMARKV